MPKRRSYLHVFFLSHMHLSMNLLILICTDFHRIANVFKTQHRISHYLEIQGICQKLFQEIQAKWKVKWWCWNVRTSPMKLNIHCRWKHHILCNVRLFLNKKSMLINFLYLKLWYLKVYIIILSILMEIIKFFFLKFVPISCWIVFSFSKFWQIVFIITSKSSIFPVEAIDRYADIL